jgi:hypothetical protein
LVVIETLVDFEAVGSVGSVELVVFETVELVVFETVKLVAFGSVELGSEEDRGFLGGIHRRINGNTRLSGQRAVLAGS